MSPKRDYDRKRDFAKTPEPRAGKGSKGQGRWPLFVIQQHAATSMHWDVRLEAEGTLKSWAVPKGPSTDPRDKRLAMPTEDHPLEYVDFEGMIPMGEYGGGPMIIWDRGVYENRSVDKRGNPISVSEGIAIGSVKVYLHGQKVSGGYALVRTGSAPGERARWLLVKERDSEADARRKPTRSQTKSVVSGRTLRQVIDEEASESDRRKAAKRLASARR
jgi:DNA ligase D-like protein (predicted 3'-phosphoesterase)